MIEQYKICDKCNTDRWYVAKRTRSYKTIHGIKICVGNRRACVKCSVQKSILRYHSSSQARTYRQEHGKAGFQKERIAAQLSVENMLRYKLDNALRYDKRDKVDPIDYGTALLILKKQNYICPITRLPLGHSFSDLRCLSIDRIDCSAYYSRTNVQFTTILGNFAKNKSTNQEIIRAFRLIGNPDRHLMQYENEIDLLKYLRTRRQQIRRSSGWKRILQLRRMNLPTVKTNFDIGLLLLPEIWHRQNGLCNITGIKLSIGNHQLYRASIDRIDAGLGYTKDNVQFVCEFINHGKREYNNSNLIELVAEIAHINRVNPLL